MPHVTGRAIPGITRPSVPSPAIGFNRNEGEQHLDWEQAHDLSERYGDSFFVMDPDRLRDNVRTWRDAFRAEYRDTDVAYPYKVNNLPPVCGVMAELGLPRRGVFTPGTPTATD